MKQQFPLHPAASLQKQVRMITLLLAAFFISGTYVQAQSNCTVTSNFFETLGGSSSDQQVKGSDGCKTMVMDDGFEIITLTLGSIPAEAADFTIVNHDASPGENEVAVKYYYYSGNAVETMEFSDAGKTAHVCNNGGVITVSWSNVAFKGSANGNITYKTRCEMTCSGN